MSRIFGLALAASLLAAPAFADDTTPAGGKPPAGTHKGHDHKCQHQHNHKGHGGHGNHHHKPSTN